MYFWPSRDRNVEGQLINWIIRSVSFHVRPIATTLSHVQTLTGPPPPIRPLSVHSVLVSFIAKPRSTMEKMRCANRQVIEWINWDPAPRGQSVTRLRFALMTRWNSSDTPLPTTPRVRYNTRTSVETTIKCIELEMENKKVMTNTFRTDVKSSTITISFCLFGIIGKAGTVSYRGHYRQSSPISSNLSMLLPIGSQWQQ